MKFSNFWAGATVVFSVAFSPAAQADTWGCEVLLCLSNPAGPMAVTQCVPPITRLYEAIFKPKPDPFPTCDMATGANGARNYADVAYNDYYEGCPTGTTALPAGVNAVQGTAAQALAQVIAEPIGNGPFSSFSVGIGEGAGQFPNSNGTPMNKKICVGNRIDVVRVKTIIAADETLISSVGVYDRVAVVDPLFNGFAIKVFMNDKLARTVRPF